MAPLLHIAIVLLVVVGGLAWLTRRIQGPGATRRSVVLTAQHALHVVELDGERLLIGTGPSGAPRLLARLPEAREVAPIESTPPLAGASAWASTGPLALLARLTRAPLGGSSRD